jgi:DNA primase
VVLAFDADRSGQDAMLRLQGAARSRRLDLKVLRLPDDKDPCDLLSEEGPDAFSDRLDRAAPFLRFQVQTVLDRSDLGSPAGKDRALAALGPVFSGAEPSAEREELVRLVADRLDLSEHLLAPLAQRRPVPAARSAPRELQSGRGLALRGERWERVFLAMCVSSGERGREYLERLSDDHLSSEVLRRARRWLLEHLDAPMAGLARDDEELRQAVTEIVMRASGEPLDDQALEIGLLGLERRRLEREIRQAGGAGDFARQHELSLKRIEITEAIARSMGEEGAQGVPSRSSSDGP